MKSHGRSSTIDPKSEDHEQLLAPFVSMKLSKVQKIRCVDKLVQFIKTIFSLVDLVLSLFVPGWDIFSFIGGLIIDILTFIPKLCKSPLRILVEAKDRDGGVTPFIITDRRNCCGRLFRCAKGKKMEFALLANEKTAILTTRKQSCFGLCCRKYHLVHASKQKKVYATYNKPFKCCPSCGTNVTTITAGETDYGFVAPCCSARMRRNRIKAGKKLKEGQLAVKKNKFSCRDCCLATIEIGMDEVDLIAGVGKATKDAIEITSGAINAGYELKDARQQLKEKGFKKLKTAISLWDVDFPTGCPGSQKLATLLFLIEVYCEVI